MSYTPTEWTNGDVITAEKLNNMENGISGSGGGGRKIIQMAVTWPSDGPQQIALPSNYSIEEMFNDLESGVDVVLKIDRNAEHYIDGTRYYRFAGYHNGTDPMFVTLDYALSQGMFVTRYFLVYNTEISKWEVQYSQT